MDRKKVFIVIFIQTGVSLSRIFINKVYLTGMFACGRDIQARYRDILASGMKPVIVDCGANIGTSLLHFLGNIRRCMW